MLDSLYNISITLLENRHHFENVDMLLSPEYYIQLNQNKYHREMKQWIVFLLGFDGICD